MPEPPDDGARRFIHHDICADHVLVDPDIGRLLGIIDFTDATVGDPVGDFVGLVGIGDRRFVDQVLAAYDLPLGDTFLDRYQWLTRTLTLIWLGEAATSDPAAVRKHTTWVGATRVRRTLIPRARPHSPHARGVPGFPTIVGQPGIFLGAGRVRQVGVGESRLCILGDR